MSRFDQCDETCTSDCGHCKGRPVAALRAALSVEKQRTSRALDLTERAQRTAADVIVERDRLRSDLNQATAVVEAAKAWRHDMGGVVLGHFNQLLADAVDACRAAPTEGNATDDHSH